MFPLDHGDLLVMDGLAKHCTVSGLQGPRVNFTNRLITQHVVSCPLAGVVGCVLPTCAQDSVEPSSCWFWRRGKQMVLFLGIGPPFVNPGDCPSGQHLGFIHIREGASLQWSASIPLGGVLPPLGVVPVGLGDGVGRLSRRRQSSKSASFYFLFVSSLGEQTLLFFLGCGFLCL